MMRPDNICLVGDESDQTRSFAKLSRWAQKLAHHNDNINLHIIRNSDHYAPAAQHDSVNISNLYVMSEQLLDPPDRNQIQTRPVHADLLIIHSNKNPISLLEKVQKNYSTVHQVEIISNFSTITNKILQLIYQFEVRPIIEEAEFQQYFRLRFQIWNELGYLNPQLHDCPHKLELDYLDRDSFPLGIFDQHQNLLACMRIVRETGYTAPDSTVTINRLLYRLGCPILNRLFAVPPGLCEPFDFLKYFAKFDRYYSRLKRRRIRIGELSRLVVRPDQRGIGLGPVLIEAGFQHARESGLKALVLVCKEDLAAYYSNNGFRPVRGIPAGNFLNFPDVSVLMSGNLRRA